MTDDRLPECPNCGEENCDDYDCRQACCSYPPCAYHSAREDARREASIHPGAPPTEADDGLARLVTARHVESQGGEGQFAWTRGDAHDCTLAGIAAGRASMRAAATEPTVWVCLHLEQPMGGKTGEPATCLRCARRTAADGDLLTGEHIGTFTVGSEPPSPKASADDD